MEQIQIDNAKCATGLAAAILDCVIAGPDGGEFSVRLMTDDPHKEPFFRVVAYTGTGERAVTVLVNEEDGEIVERQFHPIEP